MPGEYQEVPQSVREMVSFGEMVVLREPVVIQGRAGEDRGRVLKVEKDWFGIAADGRGGSQAAETFIEETTDLLREFGSIKSLSAISEAAANHVVEEESGASVGIARVSPEGEVKAIKIGDVWMYIVSKRKVKEIGEKFWTAEAVFKNLVKKHGGDRVAATREFQKRGGGFYENNPECPALESEGWSLMAAGGVGERAFRRHPLYSREPEEISIQLEPGEVLVLGSDGLKDNAGYQGLKGGIEGVLKDCYREATARGGEELDLAVFSKSLREKIEPRSTGSGRRVDDDVVFWLATRRKRRMVERRIGKERKARARESISLEKRNYNAGGYLNSLKRHEEERGLIPEHWRSHFLALVGRGRDLARRFDERRDAFEQWQTFARLLTDEEFMERDLKLTPEEVQALKTAWMKIFYGLGWFLRGHAAESVPALEPRYFNGGRELLEELFEQGPAVSYKFLFSDQLSRDKEEIARKHPKISDDSGWTPYVKN